MKVKHLKKFLESIPDETCVYIYDNELAEVFQLDTDDFKYTTFEFREYYDSKAEEIKGVIIGYHK